MKLRSSLILLTVAWGLASCGKSDPPVINGVTLSPTTIEAGGEVTLNVDVTNFALRPPSDHMHMELRVAEDEHSHEHGDSDADFPDGGHYHVYMDTTDTNPLMVNCPDHCKHPAFAASVRIKIPDDATPGSHEIIARLNHDDHKTITPHIMGKATLTVTSTGT